MLCLLHQSAGFSRLRKNSMSRLIWGGAAPGSPARAHFAGWGGALQRCDTCTVLNAALAAGVTVLARERTLPHPVKPRPLKTRSNPDCFRSLLVREARGSALLEFAIALPLLVVFVVGIYDFSGAFNQKQKIEQAAQEGAIVAGAQPTNDIASPSSPDSLQPVVTAVFNSLVASGAVPTGTCSPPGTATQPAGVAWRYRITGCPDTLIITINRGLVTGSGSPGSGSPATLGTIVTIQYPYHWRFNSVIQLLVPGASYAATTQLTETATVHNQI